MESFREMSKEELQAQEVEVNKKYQEFKDCEFNSHSKILPEYKRMLERFGKLAKTRTNGIHSADLSADELNYIIDKK